MAQAHYLPIATYMAQDTPAAPATNRNVSWVSSSAHGRLDTWASMLGHPTFQALVCISRYFLRMGCVPITCLDLVAFFDESLKRIDIGTGGIANNHTGSQMNDIHAILDHLFAGILDVAARTTIARRKTNQLHSLPAYMLKAPSLFRSAAQALPACAAAVAIADNDSDLRLRTHVRSLITCLRPLTAHDANHMAHILEGLGRPRRCGVWTQVPFLVRHLPPLSL